MRCLFSVGLVSEGGGALDWDPDELTCPTLTDRMLPYVPVRVHEYYTGSMTHHSIQRPALC